MDKNTMIKVVNRSDGVVFYQVDDLGISRHYEPGEMKEVSFEELQKLSYSAGGQVLLSSYLRMDNMDAITALLGEVEPEYFYTEEDVKNLLLNGSLAQLQDCLDFAEEGVIELVKSLAVKLEINDVSKREAIKKKTGFNVDRAIAINRETQNEEEVSEVPSKRRATPITSAMEQKSVRRTDPPKYKITSML